MTPPPKPPPGFCGECGEPCRSILNDSGFGPYEYHGVRGVHRLYGWCSDCCWADVVQEKPAEAEGVPA